MSKQYNIRSVLHNGYKIVQYAQLAFLLVRKGNTDRECVVIEFAIDDGRAETMNEVYEALARELTWHITSIEHDSEGYFDDDMTKAEIKHIKGPYLDELKFIMNLLQSN